MKQHDWHSLNRDRHDPEEMTLNDLFEEVRCAVSEQDVLALACMLDECEYAKFGSKIASALKIMSIPPPASKVAGRRIGGAA